MGYACKILADSISDAAGYRLTTFEITLPRFVLAEFNTHRMLSRNSASSRAIPVAKAIKAVEEDPFIPEQFGANQPGMQAGEAFNEDDTNFARHLWEGAKEASLDYAMGLERLGVHKGLANRVLEPFKWHTIITTGTDWQNFFALRTHESAQPEIRKIALMMQEAYQIKPDFTLTSEDWHLPLVEDQEVMERDAGIDWSYWNWSYWKKVSVGRCARVSYMTHHGERDPDADVALHDRLLESKHLSPFEHVARPFTEEEWETIEAVQEYLDGMMEFTPDVCPNPKFMRSIGRGTEYAGNLRGWWSTRMDIPGESGET